MRKQIRLNRELILEVCEKGFVLWRVNRKAFRWIIDASTLLKDKDMMISFRKDGGFKKGKSVHDERKVFFLRDKDELN